MTRAQEEGEDARVPTRRQYDILLSLGSGSAGLSRTRRDVAPLLTHGWVTADWRPPYYQWVRITPEGMHALAEAVRRYGLPEIGEKPMVTRRVCAECGGNRWRFERVAAAEIIGAAKT